MVAIAFLAVLGFAAYVVLQACVFTLKVIGLVGLLTLAGAVLLVGSLFYVSGFITAGAYVVLINWLGDEYSGRVILLSILIGGLSFISIGLFSLNEIKQFFKKFKGASGNSKAPT
jgi:hypothetical protein